MPSARPRGLDGDQVLQSDASARAEYIQRWLMARASSWADGTDLQELRFVTTRFVEGLVRSPPHLPYTVRLMAREALLALRVCYA